MILALYERNLYEQMARLIRLEKGFRDALYGIASSHRKALEGKT
jgi:hypothetical protein